MTVYSEGIKHKEGGLNQWFWGQQVFLKKEKSTVHIKNDRYWNPMFSLTFNHIQKLLTLERQIGARQHPSHSQSAQENGKTWSKKKTNKTDLHIQGHLAGPQG